MPGLGKHVNGYSSVLSLEGIGCIEIIENLMMPQFKSSCAYLGLVWREFGAYSVCGSA